jgi:hypothetical protein
MSRRSILSFGLFTILHLTVLTAFSQHHYPDISLRDIAKEPSDTFHITVLVTDYYICPPCPKGVMCKPCLGNHLEVREPGRIDSVWLRVFTENPEQFSKGKAYRLTISLRNKAHPEQGAELITTNN